MEFKVLFVLLLLYNNNCQLHLCFMVDIYLFPSIFILNLYIYCFQCCTVISEREEIFSKSVIWKLIFFSKYIRNKEAKRRRRYRFVWWNKMEEAIIREIHFKGFFHLPWSRIYLFSLFLKILSQSSYPESTSIKSFDFIINCLDREIFQLRNG